MNYIVTLILLLSLISNVGAQHMNEEVKKKKERFLEFIMKFDEDPIFQLNRIEFPLKRIFLDGEPKKDSSFISKNKWKNKKLNPWHKSYRTILYDNFEKKLRESDERVLSFVGIENGYNKSFYFRRINGKWYLVKIENLTT